MIEKSKIVNVLNYNENPVCIKTHIKEYLCQPMEDGNPSITPLDFSEIESLNSNSPVFKNGILFFDENVQKDIYDALRIIEWKDIFRNEDIEKILLHPTLDGLAKIVSIKSVMLFERVRGIFFTLKNSNQFDISTRVEKIINARYKELCNKKLKTEIILTAKDTTTPASTEEVSDLKKQNEFLQEQIINMQKMMERLMTMQNNSSDDTDNLNKNDESVSDELPKKKSGRKPKITTE